MVGVTTEKTLTSFILDSPESRNIVNMSLRLHKSLQNSCSLWFIEGRIIVILQIAEL